MVILIIKTDGIPLMKQLEVVYKEAINPQRIYVNSKHDPHFSTFPRIAPTFAPIYDTRK